MSPRRDIPRCRLCGHGPLEPVHTEPVMAFQADREDALESIIAYQGCRRCALVQVEPLPPLDWLRAYYGAAPVASLDQEVLSTVKKHYFVSTIAFLQDHLEKPPQRIFETGAASGWLLHLLAEAFQAEVAGIEPNEACRLFARREFGLDLLPGFLEDLDLAAHGWREAFDLQVCCSVLEHAAWPGRLLTPLAATLKPGGHLYLEVPSLRPPRRGVLAEKVLQPLHLSYFSPASLSRLGETSGLALLHLEEVRDLEVPVYRALYRKVEPLDHLRELVAGHAQEFQQRRRAVLEVCRRHLAAANNVWIWGIGNNFFELWREDAALFAPATCRLVDRSPAKIGKRLGELTVSPPDPEVCGEPQIILVAATSRVVQENIRQDARRHFPGVAVHSLFDCEASRAAQ